MRPGRRGVETARRVFGVERRDRGLRCGVHRLNRKQNITGL